MVHYGGGVMNVPSEIPEYENMRQPVTLNAVRRQKGMSADAWLTFSFLFSMGPQLMD